MLWLQIIPLALSITSVQADISAVVKSGKIQGASCSGPKVNSFLGIPFAQPPTGNLRFAAPVAYNSTYPGGELNATAFKPVCEQFGGSGSSSIGYLASPSSEDCLYLNVFAPASASAKSHLPVKVFIYGGSFTVGGTSDPLYNGCNLAQDAIVVTLAYRLGPLGFLALEGTDIAGNQGLQDAIMAAQWVQDNVAAFGGDPTKVMVFGESAGAGLAWIMSTMSSAPSLMKAALAESGAGALIPYGATFQQYGAEFAQKLGCSGSDTSCLQSKSVQDLIGANPSSASLSFDPTTPAWKPYVDGKLLPVQPATLPAKVPFLAGTNADEGTLFAIGVYKTPSNVSTSTYNTLISSAAGSYASAVASAYPLSSYNTTSVTSPDPGFAPFYALSALYTDAQFKCPTRRALNLTVAAKVPAYTYQNSHAPQCAWEAVVNSQEIAPLGATHSSELQFVFDQTNDLPPPNGSCSQTSQERQITQTLTAAWTSMAANGDPGNIGNQQWPAFNLQGTNGLLITNSTAVGAIDYSTCDAIWDKFASLQLVNATATTAANGSTATSSGAAGRPSSSTSANPNKASSGARNARVCKWAVWIIFAVIVGGFAKL